ncbi:DUF4304 domain-containing protein [Pseudomonas monteilii]|uniref:DUF4304 domain-containing protein n=1 Tax=Pseudomonas monteilii TaxID=76759 RepID=UPI00383A676C
MKKESSKKIFQRTAADLGFSGSNTTFLIKHGDKFLTVNFQNASGNRSFYINGGISYTELLSQTELEQIQTSPCNSQPYWPPVHVDFRAENIPGTPITQASIDEATSEHDIDKIETIIRTAIESMIIFTCNHGSREEVRRLKQARLFSAIINKEV